MLTLSSVKKFALSGLFLFCISGAYAYEAPVYDVDHYPPNFGDRADAGNSAAPKAQASTEESQPTTTQSTTASSAEGTSSADDENDEDVAPSTSSSSADDTSSLSSDQRLSRVEQQVNNLQDAKTKIDTLQTEIQTLRGQVEELSHNLQQLQTQQRTMYMDIDKRLSTPKPESVSSQTVPVPTMPSPVKKGLFIRKTPVTTKPAASVVAQQPAKMSQPNVAEEQQTYQVAYDLIKEAKYDQAIAALQKMLSKYPSGQFAANAHYWLGELYGLQGKNEQSANEFSTVIKQYPDSPKIADAQLKLGLSYAAQQKWGAARIAFKKVIDHYPGTASSRLASQQLKQIKLAGH
ncbi:MAG: tol-pal system protein YbgF [Gammaproteobacteria bacterium]|nr:tol-pal system protein YbgF [Gammaproteobacteria bacterium]